MASLVRPLARASSSRPSRIKRDDERRGVEVHVGPAGREQPRRQGGHRAVEVGGAGAHDHQRVHVGLPVLERAPRPPVESPPGPELHRRGEDEQPQVQPRHRHGGHEAEHHRQAPDEDERRERGSEEEVGFELAVLALARAFYGSTLILPHDTVAGPLNSLLQILRFDLARNVAYLRLSRLARFTLAPTTPGNCLKARSTLPTQLAHVIPVTPKVRSRTSTP